MNSVLTLLHQAHRSLLRSRPRVQGQRGGGRRPRIDMLEKHAVRGRLVYVAGKLRTRRWSKPGEDGDRFSTGILLVPGGRVQFLDKPNGNGMATQDGTTSTVPADSVAPADPGDDTELNF